ncbi:hypothetical protein [Rickettsia endosymbiont of Polydrusus tereticollis]
MTKKPRFPLLARMTSKIRATQQRLPLARITSRAFYDPCANI